MNNNDEEATIDLAIQSLQKGIDKLLQRAAVKKPHLDTNRAKKRAHRLVRHTRHLLIQLLEKRQSLQAFIEWLSEEWKTRLQAKLADPEHTQKILAHALQCLVRCQDGLMLLTSGECRHPQDIDEASKTKFPSQLMTLQERADGYTKLYSGTAYSGFGWDEYANETVGIQARLIQSLRPFHKDPWGYLEGSTQLLETVLDRQEDVVKSLKQSLQGVKEQMTTGITKQLAKPIVFSTQDKLERIQVVVPARGSHKEQKISVARLANNFQILGTSVLPNDFKTPDRWNQALALNLVSGRGGPTSISHKAGAVATGTRKRRLAILEDSDSSDEEATTTKKKKITTNTEKGNEISSRNTETSYSTGLEVRVETSKKTTETEDSLNAIKSQMGVDASGLEMARQELEHEGSAANNKGGGTTQNQDVSREEEKVQRLTKVLHRVERRQTIDLDENEIWDARECLRQAYMELGNQTLWSFRSTKNLGQALSSFEQAKALIVLQQESHQISVTRTNDQTTESRMISRNLLFLLAQATTNCGITLVETARTQQTAKKKHLAGSMRELSCARELLSKLREQATFDLSRCPAHSEQWVQTKSDILEADKLESLACRWLGISLWTTGANTSVSSAEKVLQEGWSLFRGFNVACRNQFLPQLLDLASEAILATSTAADLACSEQESLDRRTCPKQLSEQYFSIVTNALKKQGEILRRIEDLKLAGDTLLTDMVSKYQLENDIPSSQSTQQNLENIQKWWAEDSRMQSVQLSGNKNTQAQLLPRTDIASNGVTFSAFTSFSGGGTLVANPGFVVIGGGSRRQRLPPRNQHAGRFAKTALSPGSASFGSHGNALDIAFHSLDNQQSIYQRPTLFRKWGDEIIANAAFLGRRTTQDSETNSPVDEGENLTMPFDQQFAYPTAAPPVPAELRRLLETRGIQTPRQHEVIC